MQPFDASHLPAHVQTAIASIGGAHDLKLRTTIRRDDVDVWTSWMPVQKGYETMVHTQDGAIIEAVCRDGGRPYQQTDTPQAARDMHEAVCAQVRRVLARMKAAKEAR
jgi:hypothetical protein